LHWIDTDGDPDEDGFLEYARRSGQGLRHQGWKDSDDSVSHADGTLAEPPVALCEVQAYAYAARRAGARLARAAGDADLAVRLEADAARLQQRFDDAFWLEHEGTYALALDRDKRPCRVRSSNAGHCLYAGIARPDRAARVAETLLRPSSFSGWGVRTLDAGEVRYNPMSYHNGSVWPHDTAIVAAGLAAYGYRQPAAQLCGAIVDLAGAAHLHRLPELICGFAREGDRGPTLYPVACAPQAWAAGAPFLLIQACLGLRIHASEGLVTFDHPILPDGLTDLSIAQLPAGDGTVDLTCVGYPENVGVSVTRRHSRVKVVVTK
jgi:glycogen debranching enzyme